MRIGVDHDEECPCDNGITHGHRPWACEATRVYLQHAGCLSFEMSIMVTLARYRSGLFLNKYSLNRSRLSTKPNNMNSQQNALCRRGRRHFVMAMTLHLTPMMRAFANTANVVLVLHLIVTCRQFLGSFYQKKGAR